MTELLKDVLKARAEDATTPHVDLDAIIEDGDHRIRRRRVAGGLAATAAIATIALATPTLVNSVTTPDDDGSNKIEAVQQGAFSTREPTYSLGSTIHYGDQTVDVSPHEVSAFVQTDQGFVFVTSDHGIFFADGASTEQIGTTELPYGRLLSADDSGDYVAWVDTTATPAPEFVVYDTATRKEVVRTAEGSTAITDQTGEFDLPTVRAVDGQTAYWHNSDGVVAWDIAAGSGSVIQPGANSEWLNDVADGKLARMFDDLSIVVSPDPKADRPTFAGGDALLSPNADYVYTDDTDVARVFDVTSGDDVTPDHGGYPFIAVTQWVDDTTFVALGLSGRAKTASLDLLECSVSSRDCSVAASEVGAVGDVQFPIGEAIGD